MKTLPFWLRANDFKVVGFYPYTSIVQHRICEQSHNYIDEHHQFLNEFGGTVRAKAEALSVNWDNKVVVEIAFDEEEGKGYTHSNLFVGFKDGVISIGLSVWQPDAYTKQYNLKF